MSDDPTTKPIQAEVESSRAQQAEAQELESATRNLHAEIDRINADPNIPLDVRQAITQQLNGLLGKKNITAADIALAIHTAEAKAATASVAANVETVGLQGLAAAQHLTMEEQQRVNVMCQSFDVHNERSVHSFVESMVGPGAEPGVANDVTYVLTHDAKANAQLADFEKLDPKIKKTVTTSMMTAENSVEALTTQAASKRSPDDAAVSESLALVKATRNFANPELQHNLEELRAGHITRREFAHNMHEINEHIKAEAAANSRSLPPQDQQIASENGGVARTLEQAAQDQHAKDMGHPPGPHAKPRWRLAQVVGAVANVRDLDSAGRAMSTVGMYAGQQVELGQAQMQEMGASAKAVYAADVNNLHATPEQRMQAAMTTLRADRAHYANVDDATLRHAAQVGLMAADHTRNEIRDAQTKRIIALAAQTDSGIPDERDTDPASRAKRVMAAVTAAKLPTDHVSPQEMQVAVEHALQEAQQRRDAERVRERAEVIKKAIAIDAAIPDIADGSHSSRQQRVRDALAHEGVNVAYLHQADLSAAIDTGLTKAKEERDTVKAQHLKTIAGIADSVDASKEFGLSNEQRVDRIIAAYHQQPAAKMGAGWSQTHEGAGYNDISNDALRQTVRQEVAAITQRETKGAAANHAHNAHIAQLSNEATALHASASAGGKAVAAALAQTHVTVGNTEYHVNGAVAKTAGAIWESALHLMGNVQETRANLNLGHAPKHFTDQEVHHDVSAILKDPKATATLLKDLQHKGVNVAGLHLNGNAEHDTAAIQTLLKAQHVDLMAFNNNQNGHTLNAKVDEKELVDALTVALKKAGVSGGTEVAAGHTGAAPAGHGPAGVAGKSAPRHA